MSMVFSKLPLFFDNIPYDSIGPYFAMQLGRLHETVEEFRRFTLEDRGLVYLLKEMIRRHIHFHLHLHLHPTKTLMFVI